WPGAAAATSSWGPHSKRLSTSDSRNASGEKSVNPGASPAALAPEGFTQMSGREFTFAGSRQVLLTIVGVGAAALFLAFGAAIVQGIPILAVAPPVAGPIQPGAQAAGLQELDLPMAPAVHPRWEDLR